jgi:signal transduction histidine kinase/HAMP domain-containing protein
MNRQRVKEVFDSIASAVIDSTTHSVATFQVSWSRMGVQSQSLISDASRLSQLIYNEEEQLKFANYTLVFILIGSFSALLLAFYTQSFRRTLKSITKLQQGTLNVGSGNLDYKIEEQGDSEIGELSRAFNQMTTNLKNVTASKMELEREIIERKKAEAEIRSIAKFPSENPNGVFRIDKTGIIIYCNPSGQRLMSEWGTKLGETAPHRISALVKSAMDSDSDFEYEEKYGGQIFSLLFAPITEEGYVNVYANDVTNRRIAEDELRKTAEIAQRRSEALEILQKRLEEKAIEVEEYANQMEELAEQRAQKLKEAERFAAIGATAGMVGHDIRNPLQSILSELFLAKSEIAILPESDAKVNLSESVANIENDIYYINKIVVDLQDYAKIIKPRKESVNLQQAIIESKDAARVPGNIQTIVSVDEGSQQLNADSSILKRILTNLVQNAAQAMPKGGKIKITAKNKDDFIIVNIVDTGEGIPDEVRDKIFTPLFTTKSKGQGFGLAVVKRLTEALGGSVSFESIVGKGTKFTIELPK